MATGNVERRMKALLAELDYDFTRFTLDGFTRWLEDRRGRRIVFVPWRFPPDVSGVWVSGPNDTDYIFHERDTFPLHRTHIKLHEMAHMLCGHPTLELGSEDIRALLDSTVTGPAAHLALMRSIHSDEQELEAETLASLVHLKGLRRVGAEKSADASGDDFAASFSAYLESIEMDI